MSGRAWLVIAATALSLAGCGPPSGGAAPRIDDRTDPALISALDGQILVDPTLSQYSGRTAVRDAEASAHSFYPTSIGGPDAAGCQGPLQRDPGWAARLPSAFPAVAGARLDDAAGRAEKSCMVAVVQFSAPQKPRAIIDQYWRQALRHGYSGTHLQRGQDQVLFGGQGKSSYVVVVGPAKDGAEVGLVFRSGGEGAH